MWGGEGGARLKLCYFDRHLNYLIPSLLDNHQNFKIAGGSWVFHAMKKKIWKEWIPKISTISPSPALVFKIPTSRCQLSDSCTVCSYPDALFWGIHPILVSFDCTRPDSEFKKAKLKKKSPRGNFEKRGTLQSYHYFVPILSIWMCSLQRYLYNFTS